jgi:hypothetical protein
MRSQSIKRPLTAAFKGVERERAYGSYTVIIFYSKSDIENQNRKSSLREVQTQLQIGQGVRVSDLF